MTPSEGAGSGKYSTIVSSASGSGAVASTATTGRAKGFGECSAQAIAAPCTTSEITAVAPRMRTWV